MVGVDQEEMNTIEQTKLDFINFVLFVVDVITNVDVVGAENIKKNFQDVALV